MTDLLVQHARANVWCTPTQDQQIVFAPTRISGINGAVASCPVLWGQVTLPDTTSVFHVYQIGQIAPWLLDLMPDMGIWRLVAENMKTNNVIMDVYTLFGLQLPRTETYILINNDKNVILAIKDQQPLFDVRSHQIFLRLYSNAYFASPDDPAGSPKVDIYGMRVRTQHDVLVMQRKMQALQLLPGHVHAYIGGYLVNSFNPFIVDPGTMVELVYDSSIKAIYEIAVNGIPSFTSTLDDTFKYIIHHAGVQGDVIDFLDDIDFYLVKRDGIGTVFGFNGVYFHRNSIQAVRMLTHRDYALHAPFVEAYAANTPDWGDVNLLHVRVFIRHAGYNRVLVPEINRIMDLYRLPNGQLLNALTGTNSTLNNWKAATLEASAYSAIMRAPRLIDITLPQVEAAYGYGAISRLLGDSPVPTLNTGGVKSIYVPPGMQTGATMLEYNAAGVLLGFYYSPINYAYQCRNSATAWVEVISGQGSARLTSAHSVQTQALVDTQSYRYYTSPLVNGHPDPAGWVDVTADGTKHMIVNGVMSWLVDLTVYATLVRDDINFLAYTYQMTPVDGQFIFSIASTELYNGNWVRAPMQVPPGQVDLYLNGHYLVEGIDYTMAWPEVAIVNLSYLNYNVDHSVGQQTVTIIATGFCNDDLTLRPYIDTGFVRYGVMSRDNYFNLRDDKVLKIGVGGSVFPRSMVKFSEDYPDSPMAVVDNGKPYGIRQVIVPTLGNTDQNTYVLLAADQAIDLAVEDYLGQYLTDTLESNPDIIPALYQLYSPFTSKVLFDLVNGVIPMTNWMGQYSYQDVYDFLVNYRHLLPYDPALLDLDPAHVVVVPHNLPTVIMLTIYQHKFLTYAVHVYLNDAVELSNYVAILPTLV